MTDREKLADYFAYLDDLRESGVTNMFGAGFYLREAYPELGRKKESNAVLGAWMKTFNVESTPEARARLAVLP